MFNQLTALLLLLSVASAVLSCCCCRGAVHNSSSVEHRARWIGRHHIPGANTTALPLTLTRVDVNVLIRPTITIYLIYPIDNLPFGARCGICAAVQVQPMKHVLYHAHLYGSHSAT